jgi:hypothetical protein
MKYLSRFITDLLYGYPAFSNLWWGIKDDIREKTGYYEMKKIPLSNYTKWGDILTHKRRMIDAKESRKLWKAIHDYNEIIENL